MFSGGSNSIQQSQYAQSQRLGDSKSQGYASRFYSNYNTLPQQSQAP